MHGGSNDAATQLLCFPFFSLFTDKRVDLLFTDSCLVFCKGCSFFFFITFEQITVFFFSMVASMRVHYPLSHLSSFLFRLFSSPVWKPFSNERGRPSYSLIHLLASLSSGVFEAGGVSTRTRKRKPGARRFVNGRLQLLASIEGSTHIHRHIFACIMLFYQA